MTRKVPELLIEKLALGELPAAQAEAVRERLRAEPGGMQRLSDRAADDVAVFVRHPPQAVAAEVHRRLNHRRRLWVAAGALPLLAAAAALLAVPSQKLTLAVPSLDAYDTERAKGPLVPALAIHRQVAEMSELLSAGAPVKPGDVLQLTCTPRGAGHGVIVSVDGRGAVTLHFPEQPGGSTALPAGLPSVPLAHSYELDDAPAFERFFLVTAHGPIDVAAVVAAAEKLAHDKAAETAPLTLPKDQAQVDFLVRKPQ